jgi:hypothetical protein
MHALHLGPPKSAEFAHFCKPNLIRRKPLRSGIPRQLMAPQILANFHVWPSRAHSVRLRTVLEVFSSDARKIGTAVEQASHHNKSARGFASIGSNGLLTKLYGEGF